MEAVMEEAKWVKLLEVLGRSQADLVESYLNAHGIQTELIHEAYYQFHVGYSAGRVEVLVPSYQLAEAEKLYEKSGWDFDVTETDDEDFNDDEVGE
jgi:hypothetical protein